MRKIFHLTEEEKQSVSISNKSKKSVYKETLMEYEQSIYPDLESFLRTMRAEESDINFNFQKYNYNFETYEIPPGINDVSDEKNTLDK